MNTARDNKGRTIKSPLELARTAMAIAREAIPPYSSKFSRHDFTQHQLYALLALRRHFHTDYRGLEAILRDWSELRTALGLNRVPDHTTLQRAARRLRGPDRPIRGPREPMPLFDGPSPVSGSAA
jgi:hypothetical protein